MALVARNVSKNYTRSSENTAFPAVLDASIELVPGRLVEICGPSGSGKSTLLSMLAGLLEPDAGSVLLDGEDIYHLDDKGLSKLRNEHFGVIPQTPSVLSSLSVLENVTLPLSLYGVEDAQQRSIELLEEFGIDDLADEMPRDLSGGEIRRVSIARAVICEPDVVFADEPTSNLDGENTRIVLECLRKIANDGAAVFLVTHDNAADPYADEIMYVCGGVLHDEPVDA